MSDAFTCLHCALTQRVSSMTDDGLRVLKRAVDDELEFRARTPKVPEPRSLSASLLSPAAPTVRVRARFPRAREPAAIHTAAPGTAAAALATLGYMAPEQAVDTGDLLPNLELNEPPTQHTPWPDRIEEVAGELEREARAGIARGFERARELDVTLELLESDALDDPEIDETRASRTALLAWDDVETAFFARGDP